MSEEKTPWEYLDPEGRRRTGYMVDGHVYQDEAATVPVAVGSLVPVEGGDWYRMTPYGGVLWSSARQTGPDGSWIPQGNQWYRKAADLEEKLQKRPEFRYDPAQDPLYRSAKNELLTAGRRAMEDTLGRAGALSGGYASSYAETAAGQAYDRQLSKLQELLPELYDRAAKRYDSETDALYRQLGQALGLYDLDYRAYLEKLEQAGKAQSQANWQAEFDREGEQWEREFGREGEQWAQELAWNREKWADSAAREQASQAWTQERWERELAWEQEKWAEEFGWDQQKWNESFLRELEQAERKAAEDAAARSEAEAETERSYAYRMAMLALQQGLNVSDELLQTAGIDRSYADRLRRYYAAKP